MIRGNNGQVRCLIRSLPVALIPTIVAICHPKGGAESAPIVIAGWSFGMMLAFFVPAPKIAIPASFFLAILLNCIVYMQGINGNGRGPARPEFMFNSVSSGRRGKTGFSALRGAGADESRRKALSGNLSLQTLSVVLPCAFEGVFAEKTVRAISANTQPHRLREILVIDDGSHPPLSTVFPQTLLEGGSENVPARIIRHEKTKGLIAAKKTGGDAANGDVIVFLDCHISPRKGWEDAFIRQMTRAGDHRTVVVPTITSLDPNTWQESPHGSAGRACMWLLNSDFTWLHGSQQDVPLMSGGLLAISRQWWEETEGYDDRMVAWGGENLDQSFRIWLCGGRIEVAQGAYIAHMWRDPKNPATTLKYPIPTADVMRNKARATAAWLGPFTEKVFSFPEFEAFVDNRAAMGDMSNFERLKNKLKCKPFTHYLNKFKNIYFDAGIIPSEIFQLRHKSTGLCIEREYKKGSNNDVILAPCGGGVSGANIPEMQLWHAANRNSKDECCSGLANWNFNQCLDARSVGSKVGTFPCSIPGISTNQHISLRSGQVVWREAKYWYKHGGCFVAPQQVFGHARLSHTSDCGLTVSEKDDTVSNGIRKFGFNAVIDGQLVCGTTVGSSDSESLSGSEIGFRICDADVKAQQFTGHPMLGGFQIRTADGENCLDAAAGNSLLVYPCYDESVHNLNQVWQIQDGRLQWGRKLQCVTAVGVSEKNKGSGVQLRTCVPKDGQRYLKKEARDDGSCLLSSFDGQGCLAVEDGKKLVLGECIEEQRWKFPIGNLTELRHVRSNLCLDTPGRIRETVGLRRCRPQVHSWDQAFSFVEGPGWIRIESRWGDNGRIRWFEKCIDFKPVEPIPVEIGSCSAKEEWERLHPSVPPERAIWDHAEKPSTNDPPLGS